MISATLIMHKIDKAKLQKSRHMEHGVFLCFSQMWRCCVSCHLGGQGPCAVEDTWWNSLGLQWGTQTVLKTSESCALLFSVLSCVLRNVKYIVGSGTWRSFLALWGTCLAMSRGHSRSRQLAEVFLCWLNLHFQLSWLSKQSCDRACENRDCFAFSYCWSFVLMHCLEQPSKDLLAALFGILYKTKWNLRPCPEEFLGITLLCSLSVGLWVICK